MAKARGGRVAIGFMVVWLVLWGAGILVVLAALGSALWEGEIAGGLLMGLWLCVALFGLRHGIRSLRRLTGLDAPPERTSRGHAWRDAEPDERDIRRPVPPEA